MFTGLIEELGQIEKIERKGRSLSVSVRAFKVLSDMKVGDSIALNGACLTAKKVTAKSFTADVVQKTLERTTLGRLRIGERVNLERAIRPSERLGGHLVYGHVDGVGKIKEKDSKGILKINIPRELAAQLIPRDSIAVDGISLTVAGVGKDYFTVALIPHTAQITTLGFKLSGSFVNIEIDFLSKRRDKSVKEKEARENKITKTFLRERGFN